MMSSVPDDPYAALPPHLSPAAHSYPAFSQHGDHTTSPFGTSSPAEHDHAVTQQHPHIDHSTLQLDPNLSPEAPQHLHVSSGTSSHPDFSPSTSHKDAHHPQHQHSHPPPYAPPIIPNVGPPGHFDMLPPPPSTHPTWQALHSYAQSHASAHGYALSINTTAKNRTRIKLACVCYGAPKNTHKLTPETRVRKNRVSCKTGCRMWIEGKKGDDGMWVLRVGEGAHNHGGRPSEGWAGQRKRTWGVEGGRLGSGGVTALEERERERENERERMRTGGPTHEQQREEEVEGEADEASQSHALAANGPVWKIVEQEMLRGNPPSRGRDRGVGRTVQILEQRLPGIRIFKRDVYNIRAQIKRARKAAGQQLGEGLNEGDDVSDENIEDMGPQGAATEDMSPAQGDADPDVDRGFSQIDPSLIAQCNSALKNMPRSLESAALPMDTDDTPVPPPHQPPLVEETEVERLRREVIELRTALAQKSQELAITDAVNRTLRTRLEGFGVRDAEGE